MSVSSCRYRKGINNLIRHPQKLVMDFGSRSRCSLSGMTCDKPATYPMRLSSASWVKRACRVQIAWMQFVAQFAHECVYCPFSHGRARYFSLYARKKSIQKKAQPNRAVFLILSQRIEHPHDTLSLRDRAKIGVHADFDADVTQN